MMTPLEAVRQIGAEAAPALAKNSSLVLCIEVEKEGAGGRRRVSMDKAVRMA